MIRLVTSLFVALVLVLAGYILTGCDNSAEHAKSSRDAVTYHSHIAPIIARQCATCHRPNGAGPLSLLSFEDVKKHAEQIVKVTQTHFMPPWLPEPGFGHFASERRLTSKEIQLIAQWVANGAPAGAPTDAPTV